MLSKSRGVSKLFQLLCGLSLFLAYTVAPLDIGPGSYLLDKADLKGIERFKPMKYQPKPTNWASMPRFNEQKKQTSEDLGPGAYREINKWNKRTYNLKFLNNQT